MKIEVKMWRSDEPKPLEFEIESLAGAERQTLKALCDTMELYLDRGQEGVWDLLDHLQQISPEAVRIARRS